MMLHSHSVLRSSFQCSIISRDTYDLSVFCTAAGLASPHIASSVFSLGTAAVLPFYTLIVLASKAELKAGYKDS
ncbi:hypothetical protein Vadar_032245 [Vaccinium darrowii]|uniref:Uncharacterized protein n=1 Tax=Vaccinium darrowii TaxID=229202 RepID=A0ACB7XE17_9ERIC|nr:hypothetical protein Vadar_032245 [Vaccinium darrowii]